MTTATPPPLATLDRTPAAQSSDPDAIPATGGTRLADPPALEGAWAWLEPYVRPAFIQFNRRFMLPVHRAGLAAWVGTPIGGYILVLHARGRRSGVVRETPLSYLVADGSVWVLAGFGRRTEWYRNLLADPKVEIRMPGRRYAAVASEATDAAVRARILPALARAAGLPGLMIGANPWTAGDQAVLSALDWIPLVRLDPVPGPIESGPDDPGGRAWLWRQGLVLGLVALVAWGLSRVVRAPRR